MVEIDPDYEDFYECQGPLNKAVSIICFFCIVSHTPEKRSINSGILNINLITFLHLLKTHLFDLAYPS